MKPVRLALDFRPATAGPSRWAAWGALAMAVVLALWLSERHSRSQQALETLQARNDELQQRLRPPREARAPAPSADAAKRIQQANAVIQRLTLPWEELFRAVEAADSRGLALLSLEPNGRDMTLRVAGEVRSVGELLSYVERLSRQPGLGQVHLVGYETVQRDGAEIISFTLAARWQRS